MSRRAVLIMIILLVLTGISWGEEIEVVETILIQDSPQDQFYFPSYSQDGQNILFTGPGYIGLWSYSISTKELSKLTGALGAGYDPISIDDGTIVFRQDKYVNNLKFSSYIKLNPETKEEVTISNPGRFVSKPSLSEFNLYFFENNQLQSKSIHNRNTINKSTSDIALLNDNLKIQLVNNGLLTVLSPKGEGSYIWAELSPQKDRILFTKTGEGTYICNLEGKILAELGYAHAPRWSPDGRFVVYMKDYDDGAQFLESNIWIVSHDGSKSWKITDTPNKVEMYPQWSPDGLHIVFHVLEGNIYQTEIRLMD